MNADGAASCRFATQPPSGRLGHPPGIVLVKKRARKDFRRPRQPGYNLAMIDAMQLPAREVEIPPDEARREECARSILLALTLCGAALNGRSMEFARGIAEILIWSAEHGQSAAAYAGDQAEAPEWQCGSCGEYVPDNFDLCWNCEAIRPEQ